MPADPTPDRPLDNARALVHGRHVRHALETALAAAGRKGVAALERQGRWDGQVTPEESARRFLEAVQAAGEELDRLALAVAEAMEATPIAGCGPAGPP
jgi:hypothetical protein